MLINDILSLLSLKQILLFFFSAGLLREKPEISTKNLIIHFTNVYFYSVIYPFLA